MSVSAPQMRGWMDRVDGGITISAAASAASMSRVALTQQLMRGKVNSHVVVAICRKFGLDPIQELATFVEFAGLRPANPRTDEAIALIDWPELLQAVGMQQRRVHFGDLELGTVGYPGAERLWVDALDAGSGTLRTEVAAQLGVSNSSIAHAISAGLKPHVAVTFSRCAGTPLATALVVSGLLKPGEAGWARDARASALHRKSTVELLEIVAARSAHVLRQEKRLRSFEEELG